MIGFKKLKGQELEALKADHENQVVLGLKMTFDEYFVAESTKERRMKIVNDLILESYKELDKKG